MTWVMWSFFLEYNRLGHGLMPKKKLAVKVLGLDIPGGSDGKMSVYNAGDPGLIPGLGRSPGQRNGNPLQDYCLENPMDRGAW